MINKHNLVTKHTFICKDLFKPIPKIRWSTFCNFNKICLSYYVLSLLQFKQISDLVQRYPHSPVTWVMSILNLLSRHILCSRRCTIKTDITVNQSNDRSIILNSYKIYIPLHKHYTAICLQPHSLTYLRLKGDFS